MTLVLKIVKTLLVALSLLGVIELGSQAKYGKSSIEIVRGALRKSMRFTSNSSQQDLADEELRHQKMWGQKDQTKGVDSRGDLDDEMKKKLDDMKTCRMKCGHDQACRQQCPRPWKAFQEKCEKLQPIFACHRSCSQQRSGVECHSKCPLPEDPKMAAKMQAAMQCNSKCKKGEHMCYQKCPKPMYMIRVMCQGLNETASCHEKCEPGNFQCHDECPRWKRIWSSRGQKKGRNRHMHGQHKDGRHKKGDAPPMRV